MCRVSKCCCCISIETGCKVLGILGTIGATLNVLISGGQVLTADRFDGLTVAFTCIWIFSLVIHVTLLVGTYGKQQGCVLTYLVLYGIWLSVVLLLLIGEALLLLHVDKALGIQDQIHPRPEFEVTVGRAIGYTIGLLLGIHFWLVAYTFRQDLLTNAGTVYEMTPRA